MIDSGDDESDEAELPEEDVEEYSEFSDTSSEEEVQHNTRAISRSMPSGARPEWKESVETKRRVKQEVAVTPISKVWMTSSKIREAQKDAANVLKKHQTAKKAVSISASARMDNNRNHQASAAMSSQQSEHKRPGKSNLVIDEPASMKGKFGQGWAVMMAKANLKESHNTRPIQNGSETSGLSTPLAKPRDETGDFSPGFFDPMQSFYSAILKWDFISALWKETQSNGRSGQRGGSSTSSISRATSKWRSEEFEKKGIKVPDRFATYEEYLGVWKPLAVEELRAQTLNNLSTERVRGAVNIDLRVLTHLTGRETFLTLQVVLKNKADHRAVKEMYPNDLVFLSTEPRAVQRAMSKAGARGVGSLLGLVTSSIWSREGLQMKVLVKHWVEAKASDMWVVKLASLVTSLREFRALCECRNYPLLPLLLTGKNAPGTMELSSLGAHYVTWMRATFNDSQQEAIAAAATSNGFTLIKGPPGTGKTTTLKALLNSLHLREFNRYYHAILGVARKPDSETAKAWAELGNSKPHILVAAPSNIAVDNIISKIKEEGFCDGLGRQYFPAITRVGRGLSSTVRDVSLDEQISNILGLPLEVIERMIAQKAAECQKVSRDSVSLRHELRNLVEAVTAKALYDLNNAVGTEQTQMPGWGGSPKPPSCTPPDMSPLSPPPLSPVTPPTLPHHECGNSPAPPSMNSPILTETSASKTSPVSAPASYVLFSPDPPVYEQSSPSAVSFSPLPMLPPATDSDEDGGGELPPPSLPSPLPCFAEDNNGTLPQFSDGDEQDLTVDELPPPPIPAESPPSTQADSPPPIPAESPPPLPAGSPPQEGSTPVSPPEETPPPFPDSPYPSQPAVKREKLTEEELLEYLEQHPRYHELATALNGCLEHKERLSLELKRLHLVRTSHSRGGKSNMQTRQALEVTFLDTAHIVFTTLSSAGLPSLDSTSPFEVLVVDEAAQAVELSALIPMRFGSRQCVLVGDPQQLPATCFSKGSEMSLYERSLFERLESCDHPVHMLRVQYRSHPEISKFPRNFFYDGQLEDGDNVLDASYNKPYHNLSAGFQPFNFFDLATSEESTNGSVSRRNVREAQLAFNLYKTLKDACRREDIVGRVGVITPYSQQQEELKTIFSRELGAEYVHEVEISTVDGFQGREKDIIILSTVRAEKEGGVGFLNDIRRMNVALTRAKYSIFVLGHEATLRSSLPWRALLDYAWDNNYMVRVPSADVDLLTLKPTPKPQSAPKYTHKPLRASSSRREWRSGSSSRDRGNQTRNFFPGSQKRIWSVPNRGRDGNSGGHNKRRRR